MAKKEVTGRERLPMNKPLSYLRLSICSLENSFSEM